MGARKTDKPEVVAGVGLCDACSSEHRPLDMHWPEGSEAFCSAQTTALPLYRSLDSATTSPSRSIASLRAHSSGCKQRDALDCYDDNAGG